MIVAALAISCQEPNYRTEVVANGQGGVVTRKIPKEQPDGVAPPIAASPTLNLSSQPTESIDRQIENLQTKVREMNAEIDRLTKLKAAKND